MSTTTTWIYNIFESIDIITLICCYFNGNQLLTVLNHVNKQFHAGLDHKLSWKYCSFTLFNNKNSFPFDPFLLRLYQHYSFPIQPLCINIHYSWLNQIDSY